MFTSFYQTLYVEVPVYSPEKEDFCPIKKNRNTIKGKNDEEEFSRKTPSVPVSQII